MKRGPTSKKKLFEGALTPVDLQDQNLLIKIKRNSKSASGAKGWTIECVDKIDKKSDSVFGSLGSLKSVSDFGIIAIRQSSPGSCENSYEVVWSLSQMRGLGPFLYDIAMEIASLEGFALMSDRRSVSSSAKSVWNYYDKQRSDVEKVQLDNKDGSLTPDYPDDDCIQVSSYELADEEGIDWNETSLSKAYKKKNSPIIDELLMKGLVHPDSDLPGGLSLPNQNMTEAKIRSFVKKVLKEDDGRIKSVGELKKALQAARGQKVKNVADAYAKKAGFLGLKAALGLIPGGGTLATAIEAGAEIKDVIDTVRSIDPKAKKNSPLWDILSIDPNIADVVDAKVEDDFIKDYAQGVERLPDDSPIPDADVAFSTWLKRDHQVKIEKA